MSAQFSEKVALRIGLAARVLPDTETSQLVNGLVETLGLPLTEEKLNNFTVRQLNSLGDGMFKDVPLPDMKKAMDFLWGKAEVTIDDQLPKVESYSQDDMPDSIRVAVASNTKEDIDGHFGSCTRFLIYQVSSSETRLIDIRTPAAVSASDDKNAHRAALIRDCDVLFVNSIGGPPAAKVVREDIHPIKFPNGGGARDELGKLQTVLDTNPPPWLARIMGKETGLDRFVSEEEAVD